FPDYLTTICVTESMLFLYTCETVIGLRGEQLCKSEPNACDCNRKSSPCTFPVPTTTPPPLPLPSSTRPHPRMLFFEGSIRRHWFSAIREVTEINEADGSSPSTLGGFPVITTAVLSLGAKVIFGRIIPAVLPELACVPVSLLRGLAHHAQSQTPSLVARGWGAKAGGVGRGPAGGGALGKQIVLTRVTNPPVDCVLMTKLPGQGSDSDVCVTQIRTVLEAIL
ncbi:hypothetical protein BaRGS_00031082, partial [Batillaria attramentaria]